MHAADYRLLNVDVDADEKAESEFRILVEGKYVKYLTIEGGIYNVDVMCFGPDLIPQLPEFPPGNWNQGRISRNPIDGRPYFVKVEKSLLPTITNIWHPLKIDHLDLHLGARLRSSVYEATIHHPKEVTVIVKYARFAFEIPWLDVETCAYKWIQDHDIGPKFLGHLMEEGRAIGFIIERIASFRHATLEDLPMCQEALSKLHQLGIKHGDINKHNFLIHDGKATLIDFDVATRDNDAKTLADEFGRLEQELCDSSGRGGIRAFENSPS